MSPSKTLFFFCISFIVGIFVESLIKIPQSFLWGFLFFSVLVTIFALANVRSATNFSPAVGNPLCPSQAQDKWTKACKKFIASLRNYSPYVLVSGFCLLFVVLGVLRMQISEFNIANDVLSKYNGKGEIVLQGTISKEPDIRETHQKINVKVANSIILVTTSKYPEFEYKDEIKLKGKLETPSQTEDFSYKNYLAKDGIYSVMNYPKIEITSKEHKHNLFSYLYEKIIFLKNKIRSSIQKNFLPPQSSILEGTILGDNSAMTKDLKDKLNITGLRHIIAVSGTHVVILSAIIMSLLLSFGLWRGHAFYVALAIICVYIVLTGLPASGLRAGIMGGVLLFAQKVGRQAAGIRLISLAGSTMLMLNPLLLFYDVGFQLSFLAVVGLIYFEPPIKYFFKKITRPKEGGFADGFLSIVSTTFAAQIFTLPIMIYDFGRVSYVSPITNLLILPIVYWLMIFGFLTSFLGIFSSFLGWALSFPCWLLLSYFVKVIELFSQPWMAKTIEGVSAIWIFISYLLIAFLAWFLNKKLYINTP